MAGALRQPLHSTTSAIQPLQLSKPRATGISPSSALFLKDKTQGSSKLSGFYGHGSLIVKLVGKASQGKGDITPAADDPENGVSLGTMKLPSNTDLQRFETLLFQVLYLHFFIFLDLYIFCVANVNNAGIAPFARAYSL